MKSLAEKIKRAKTLILSTHKQCDGDGLGAELALFHALKKIGKDVHVINVDATPTKYSYLYGYPAIEIFLPQRKDPPAADLALIFDTNDHRLLEPLYERLQKSTKEIIFVDHHPLLADGPQPTANSLIDINAASTGEIAFRLIRELRVPLDEKIAQAIYTSVAFDTQIFRYVRNSPESHLMAAELLKFDIQPEFIHQRLFGNQTPSKIAYLAKVLASIEYFEEGRLVALKIKESELESHGLDSDQTRDIVDMIMNIESVEIALVFREDGPKDYKISLRSKGRFDVKLVAEAVGGGGHRYSAGAYVKGGYNEIREKLVDLLTRSLKAA